MTEETKAVMKEEKKEEDKGYYYNIPEYPENFTPATVLARAVDGLGFRYFWSTEGLTEEDLTYKASESGRTIRQTMEHMHGLTRGVYLTIAQKPITNLPEGPEKTYEQIRNESLEFIEKASKILKANPNADLSQFNVVFQRGERSSEYPIWNLINGQLSDALWHTGQVVMLRRAAGNPLASGVSVFSGTKRDR